MSTVELYSYFSYIGPLWLAALFGEAGNNRRLRYHINQGLLLSLLETVFIVAALLLKKPICSVPKAGNYLFFSLAALFFAVSIVLAVKGMVNVSQGKQAPLPVIGHITLIR